jgi:tRNA1Val (adenine37-N6)-methyltransferase
MPPANQPFRFKQFAVAQSKCAMKVNTDGVLLGAWADVSNAKQILDVGTGTGVIALMMVQKNLIANVDAIDIDADAFLQAKENFEQSAWRDRLLAYHVSLQNFHPTIRYDIIITNPPYFVDDTKTGNQRKNVAKHSIELSYADLLVGVSRLLTEDGKFFVVLPAFNLAPFETEAAFHFLFITQLIEVIAVDGKAPYLVLIELQRKGNPYLKDSLTIQNTNGDFTDAYKMLTKDFYLKF